MEEKQALDVLIHLIEHDPDRIKIKVDVQED